ncbi:hypothetical protein NEMBOFW57_002196 [Staphylotrichum longicolle]|uniref:Protein kinase domain-containing protein n=1 Tax=Staphylotrichum longicolle TaxID=669026 RepID=A0AAD4F318_9PEZI|nr:hypothetical protein NEMBOFW57_002196 [Staphylotrichum longicolle]
MYGSKHQVHGAATSSPTLYQEGRPLDLQLGKSYSPNLPSRVTATISRVISMTMSVVLDVTLQLHQGPPVHRVLKLYDRRFGSCLRKAGKDSAAPYTQENGAAFEAFVRRGMMPGFLHHREEMNETENLPVRARGFLDEPNRTEGLAKYEAALWQDCIEHFECETKAYHRLADAQGMLVPRIHGHVSLSATKLAAIIPQETAPYFELAVDAAHEINKRGVIMEDCAPRNVVVDRQSQTPRLVDLARCIFRDEMASEWCQWRWHEDENWDPDVEYWEQASTTSNPGAIGAVMANRVQRKTGVKLDFRYPDWSGIIAKIRRRKEEAAAGERETLDAKGVETVKQ